MGAHYVQWITDLAASGQRLHHHALVRGHVAAGGEVRPACFVARRAAQVVVPGARVRHDLVDRGSDGWVPVKVVLLAG